MSNHKLPTSWTMGSRADPVEKATKARGAVRSRDVEDAGLPRSYVARAVKRGALQRVGRGLYIPAGTRITAHHTLVEAAVRVPVASEQVPLTCGRHARDVVSATRVGSLRELSSSSKLMPRPVAYFLS